MCGCGSNYTGGCGCKSNMTGDCGCKSKKKVHPSKAHKSKYDGDGVYGNLDGDVYGNLDGYGNSDVQSSDKYEGGMYGNLDGDDASTDIFGNLTGKEKLQNLGTKAKTLLEKGQDLLGGLKNGTGSTYTDNTQLPTPAPEDKTMLYVGIAVALVAIIGIIIYVKNK